MKALLAKAGVVAIFTIALDQLTKGLARGLLELCTIHGAVGCERVRLVGHVELIRVRNAGSAFGFSQDLWLWTPIATAAVALAVVYLRSGRPTRGLAVAAGLQVGGAFGNLADRVVLGGVTDFIHLGAGPVFNLADLFLAAGAVLAIYRLSQESGMRSRATRDLTDQSVRIHREEVLT